MSKVKLKLKLLIIVSPFILFNAVSAAPKSWCQCSKTIAITECEKQNSSSQTTWWHWVTSSNNPSLHFFQLMELMHQPSSKDKTHATKKDA